MKKRETAHLKDSEMATAEQIRDIMATMIVAMPMDTTKEGAQHIIGNKSRFVADLKALIYKYEDEKLVLKWISRWKDFYVNNFQIELDDKSLVIPTRPRDFDKMVVVAPEVTMNILYKWHERILRKTMSYWGDDLDTAVPANEREPKDNPYAIWVKHLKYDPLAEKEENKSQVVGITLLEALLHSAEHLWRTRFAMEIEHFTVCIGSSDKKGKSPTLEIFYNGITVGWCWTSIPQGNGNLLISVS